eukprot:3712766-Prymnesium_polylepis.1
MVFDTNQRNHAQKSEFDFEGGEEVTGPLISRRFLRNHAPPAVEMSVALPQRLRDARRAARPAATDREPARPPPWRRPVKWL